MNFYYQTGPYGFGPLYQEEKMKKAAFLLCALVLTFALAGCEANADVKGDASDGKIGASADIEAGTDAGDKDNKTDAGKDQNTSGTNDGTINGTYNGTAGDNKAAPTDGNVTGTAADSSAKHKVGTSVNRAAGVTPGDPSSSIRDYWFTSRAPLD